MNAKKRQQIRLVLRSLAESHVAALEQLQQAFVLLDEESALDPLSFWEAHTSSHAGSTATGELDVDAVRLMVTFRGRRCFLGNTLAFRFLARLARHPNAYVSHKDLLEDVWEGPRSESSIRSVVKTLRRKLRDADLAELANAIDGSERKRYALKLDN